MTSSFDSKLFEAAPLVGILRGFTLAESLQAVEAVVSAGITTVEVTLNSPDALQQIRELQSRFAGRINIGAGTVCKRVDAEAAIAHGASFLVTPTVSEEVIEVAVQTETPAMVGAMTPTEILKAWDLGATLVKVFPADALGPGYLKSVLGPLSQVRLMPTGGITVESLPAYLKAGAVAFGIGSPLFDPQRIAAEDWQWLTDQAERFVDVYQRARSVSATCVSR